MKHNFSENLSTQLLKNEAIYKPPCHWRCKNLNRGALVWREAQGSPAHCRSMQGWRLNEIPNEHKLDRNWRPDSCTPPQIFGCLAFEHFFKANYSVILEKKIPSLPNQKSAFHVFYLFFKKSFVKITPIWQAAPRCSYFSCSPLPLSLRLRDTVTLLLNAFLDPQKR